jgi:hypothetical protein
MQHMTPEHFKSIVQRHKLYCITNLSKKKGQTQYKLYALRVPKA